jgi:hypothetical protein
LCGSPEVASGSKQRLTLGVACSGELRHAVETNQTRLFCSGME